MSKICRFQHCRNGDCFVFALHSIAIQCFSYIVVVKAMRSPTLQDPAYSLFKNDHVSRNINTGAGLRG